LKKYMLRFPSEATRISSVIKIWASSIKKTVLETPDDWRLHIASFRTNPPPFVVVKCDREFFKAHGKNLKIAYIKRFAHSTTRPVQEFVMSAHEPRSVTVRDS